VTDEMSAVVLGSLKKKIEFTPVMELIAKTNDKYVFGTPTILFSKIFTLIVIKISHTK
jgi:hypothetical protein